MKIRKRIRIRYRRTEDQDTLLSLLKTKRMNRKHPFIPPTPCRIDITIDSRGILDFDEVTVTSIFHEKCHIIITDNENNEQRVINCYEDQRRGRYYMDTLWDVKPLIEAVQAI